MVVNSAHLHLLLLYIKDRIYDPDFLPLLEKGLLRNPTLPRLPFHPVCLGFSGLVKFMSIIFDVIYPVVFSLGNHFPSLVVTVMISF